MGLLVQSGQKDVTQKAERECRPRRSSLSVGLAISSPTQLYQTHATLASIDSRETVPSKRIHMSASCHHEFGLFPRFMSPHKQ